MLIIFPSSVVYEIAYALIINVYLFQRYKGKLVKVVADTHCSHRTPSNLQNPPELQNLHFPGLVLSFVTYCTVSSGQLLA